jgi:hypothetical protein
MGGYIAEVGMGVHSSGMAWHGLEFCSGDICLHILLGARSMGFYVLLSAVERGRNIE